MPWKCFCLKSNGKTAMFNVTNCEKCGKLVTDVNAVGGSEKDIPKYLALGMVEYPEKPFDELWWSDELGMAVCTPCWEDAKEDN